MASRPDKPQRAYRIADARFPIFDGTGAALVGGRWNSAGRPVIYASLSYAAAMLERLVHAGTGRIPRNHRAVVITIGNRAKREIWTAENLPAGWHHTDCRVSRGFGDRWLEEQRSVALIVPSVIAKYEQNVVINPAHQHFSLVRASRPEIVKWDLRLFER